MAKFHVNEKGEPGQCKATFRPCPLGLSADEHHKSPEAARLAYENSMEEKLGSDLTSASTKSSVRGVTQPSTNSFVFPPPKLPAASRSAEEKRVRVRAAADDQKVAAAIKTNITSEVTERWRNSPDPTNVKLAKTMERFQNGKITEKELADSIGNDGVVAYEDGVKQLRDGAIEKVRLDNLQATHELNASIKAQQDAIVSSIESKTLGYSYDIREEQVDPLPSPKEVAARKSQVAAKLERLKQDMPIYRKFAEIHYGEDSVS